MVEGDGPLPTIEIRPVATAIEEAIGKMSDDDW
jgi:hypothetical protein